MLKKPLAAALPALLAGLLAAPTPLVAAECTAPSFGQLSVRIDDDTLVAERSGLPVNAVELPMVGSGWRCLAMHVYPEHQLLFMEWHQGEAGTSQMFHQVSLLSFAVDRDGVHATGDWTLRQGYRGIGPDIIEADRTYRLEEHQHGVDVVLEGLLRFTIDRR